MVALLKANQQAQLEFDRRFEFKEELRKCRAKNLTEDETIECMCDRFGQLSQRETGRVPGITRQRVEQIERGLLKKLRRTRLVRELIGDFFYGSPSTLPTNPVKRMDSASVTSTGEARDHDTPERECEVLDECGD